MTILDNLHASREAEHRAAEAILAGADRRGDFSPADRAAFEAHRANIADFDARIAEVTERDNRSARVDAAGSRYSLRANSGDPGLDAFLRGQTSSFDLDFRGIHREVRDLSVGTAGAGGNIRPTSFAGELYEHLIASSAIRRTNVNVLTTQSGEDLILPKTTTHPTATLTTEAATITENDPVFAQVTMKSYKYAVLIDVSNELLTDSGVDLTSYLARQTGRALGNASGTHFVTGDDSGKPQGAVTGSTLGKTAAGAAAITADELLDLYFSVLPEYRANGWWMMADSTLAYISKLKDSDNNYLLRSNNAGAPDSLFGRPVVTDPNMPAMTTGNKSVLFGDFASGYTIRDVRGVRFESSSDAKFETDQTSFRAILRTDGRVVDSSAIKHLIQA